jgi:sulfite reductase alpha subunit-like flavoprotein
VQASGVLTDLQVAFSRKAAQPKTYVQHLIKAEGEQLWGLLNSTPAARVYVCGDAKHMAPDVRATFVEIAESIGGISREAAESWMQDMREDAKYLEDVWAS